MNPDGFDDSQRHNHNFVDLNRNFDDRIDVRTRPAQPETLAIKRVSMIIWSLTLLLLQLFKKEKVKSNLEYRDEKSPSWDRSLKWQEFYEIVHDFS